MTESTPKPVRQRLYAFLVTGLGGLVASAVSFGMTLYDAAHPPQTPVAQAGQQIDTGRWFVTLRSAHFGTIPPTGVVPFDPKPLLMVDLDIANRSATASNVVNRVVMLDDPAVKLMDPTIYLDRDKYIAGFFNPDMPERVTLAWEWPSGTPMPKTATFKVNSQIYKIRDNLYGASGWYDQGTAATVELPVAGVP
jgi:hypothetical protein